jgi:hypothetical protein
MNIMSRADITPEELVGEEWAEWYRMTPVERFTESMRLWETYLALGGSLEPEPDAQSPFFDPEESRQNAAADAIQPEKLLVLRRYGLNPRQVP